MGEHDDLAVLSQFNESVGNQTSPHMVERRDRVIKNERGLRCVKIRFCKKRRQAKGGFLPLTKDLRHGDALTSANELWLMQQRSTVGASFCDRDPVELQSICLAGESIADDFCHFRFS